MTPDTAIKREYALRKRRAEEERDRRVAAVYQRIPRLQRIEEEERDTILLLGKSRGEEREALRAKIERLREERREIFREEPGLEEQFRADYGCSLCADTGYVEGRLCACLKRRLTESAFGQKDEGASFADFDENIYPGERQKKRSLRIRDFCRQYAEAFPNNEPKGILLFGQTGLGKSFLLSCIARRVRERGYSAVNLTAYKLVNDVLRAIREKEFPEDYIKPDLLIIDDLGVEPMLNKITVENLFLILNERQAEGKATLIATNLGPAMLEERYGERMFSRLLSNRLFTGIAMEGEDLRIRR